VVYTVVTRHLQALAREVSNLKPGSSLKRVRLQRKKSFHDELDTLAVSINHFRDRQAEAESALNATRSELARITQMMTATQMTASIAHEINQPLGAITANSGAALRWLARAPPDIAEATAAIKNVIRDGQRAGQVIGSLRAMFQKGDDKRTLSDINGLIKEVLSLLEADFRTNSVSLVVDLQDGIPQVSTDRIQLQQVFMNLIVNAVEAMEPIKDRERVLKMTSRTEDGSGIVITVEDTGPGIETKNADRIFETFFTTKRSGMGMGLAICKSVVEAHHGRLWASPRSPYGSIFHVTLPAGEPKDNGESQDDR
jgi:signal transduction histidine kinase